MISKKGLFVFHPARIGAPFQIKSLLIEPGSPWENEFIEVFNGKMSDELLNREIFYIS
jgi:hypothetical protein